MCDSTQFDSNLMTHSVYMCITYPVQTLVVVLPQAKLTVHTSQPETHTLSQQSDKESCSL